MEFGCAEPMQDASQFTSPALQDARQDAVGEREKVVVVGVLEEVESAFGTRKFADASVARARRMLEVFILILKMFAYQKKKVANRKSSSQIYFVTTVGSERGGPT